MLVELSIKDFAIMDEISINFREGLTVLTGETGAGKSIIIDAIQLLAGGRGSVEFVRHGANKAEIEGLFQLDNREHPAFNQAGSLGIEYNEEGMFVLQRTITSSGKSICRVNGKLVTLGILREIGQTLIDIHSQHETQSLMDVDQHIELLDLYNQKKILPILQDYRKLYKQYINLKRRYKELSENEQELAHRLDLLEFQLNEIQEAELQPNEDKVLEEQRSQLANYERIYKAINDAYHSLYGERKGIDWLSLALSSLESAQSYDEDVKKKVEELSNHYYLVEEISFDLRNKLDNLSFNTEELNLIEGRLNEISRLKKKYGQSVEEILEYASKIEEEIDEIKNRDSHLIKLVEEIEELGEDVVLEAQHLHDLRKNAATELTDLIHKELKDLYLEKAAFGVHFSRHEGSESDPIFEQKHIKLTAKGFDIVKFMISTNPGEPLKDIQKVASGGELSRIMLAIKKIFAKHQGVTSVIFDEVDTGVSGRVAQAIAEKIYQVATSSQVLCISHLPQVASMADTHLLIEKHVKEDRTKTSVTEMSEALKIDEISRMISGAQLTDTTIEHAKELLQLAKKFKTS